MRRWLSFILLVFATLAFGHELEMRMVPTDLQTPVFHRNFPDVEAKPIPYFYNPFSNLISRTGDTPNNYLYCGEQYDSDLGLYYNRARYLNTGSGRFWTSDRVDGFRGNPISLQRYIYGSEDPVNNFDPNGLFTLKELKATLAVIAIIASPPLYYYRTRALVDANDEYARTLSGTPITIHGKNYYSLTPAGRRIVDVHEKVHQQQGFFANFKNEAEVELPAYRADLEFARLLRVIGRLTPEEVSEVDSMINEFETMIQFYEQQLGK